MSPVASSATSLPDADRVIELEYIFTEAVAIEGARALTREIMPRFRFLPWLGALLLALAVYVIADSPASWLAALFPGGFGLFFVLIPMLTRVMVVRGFRRMPAANSAFTFRITRSEFHARGVDGESRFTWGALTKIVETARGFLLFTGPRLGRWVPKAAFPSADDLALFQTWVEANRPKFGSGETVSTTAAATTMADPATAAAEPSASITATFVYSQDDALTSHRILLRSRSFLARYFAAFLIMTMIVVFVLAEGSLVNSAPYVVTFVTLFLVLIWRAHRRQKRATLDAFAQSPNADREVRWTISQLHIAIRGAHSNDGFGWKSVLKVRETEEGFLVFPHPQIATWLPHRAFASPHDAAVLRAWINRHGIDFKRV